MLLAVMWAKHTRSYFTHELFLAPLVAMLIFSRKIDHKVIQCTCTYMYVYMCICMYIIINIVSYHGSQKHSKYTLSTATLTLGMSLR